MDVGNLLVDHHLWVSGILLFGVICSSVAVGRGILLEIPENPSPTEKLAVKWVMWGIGLEAVFTILLFVTDAEISKRQQDTIIDLETQIAPRVLSQTDFEAIVHAVKGRTKAVSVGWPATDEAVQYESQIVAAFQAAGLTVLHCRYSPAYLLPGSLIVFPTVEQQAEGVLGHSPVYQAAEAAHLDPIIPATFDSLQVDTNCRKDVPMLYVGARMPHYKNLPYLGSVQPK